MGQSPLTLFPVAIGCSALGRSADDGVAGEILDLFLDLGGNFIAGTGLESDDRGEEAIGAWVAERGVRDSVLLGTTVGRQLNLSTAVGPTIRSAVESALARLRTDRIDLLSLELDREVPTIEVLVAVDDLVRAGKVRFVATTVPSPDRLIEARVAAAQHGIAPVVAVQAPYSLINRVEHEGELSRLLVQQGFGFLPRSPLAGGFLSGQYRTRSDINKAVGRGASARALARRGPAIVAALDSIARAQGAVSASIALAWLLTKPGVVAPIVSVSSRQQVLDLVAATRVQLTRHQLAELDRISH